MGRFSMPEELMNHIRGEISRMNYQLVDVTVKGKDTAMIEIILDREGGITLDECSRFNRDIAGYIEQSGFFGGMFTLDVCSPGLDRELRTDNDYLWARGKKVRVVTYDQKVIVGKLFLSDDPSVLVVEEESGAKVNVERHKVSRARLWVEE